MAVDFAPIVEKLEVQRGDIVFVLVPDDLPTKTMESISEALSEFVAERGGVAVVAPDYLRFKVVHATEADA